MNTKLTTQNIEFQKYLEKLRNEIFNWVNMSKAVNPEEWEVIISGDKIYLSFKMNGVEYEQETNQNRI